MLPFLCKRGITIVVMLLLVISLFAQNREKFDMIFRVVYTLNYQPDSNNADSRSQEDMELLWDGHSSLFRSVNRGRNDSIRYYGTQTGSRMAPPVVQSAVAVNKLNYQIKKTENRIITFDAINGRSDEEEMSYYYQESPNQFHWKILKDTIRIHGFFCQKATVRFSGRTWMAWFTPEISIADGPYSFCGLPGLILKITDSQGYWDFEATDIQNIQHEVVINFRESVMFKPIDKSVFLRKRRNYQQHILDVRVASGSNLPNIGIVRAKMEAVLEKDNNWIELLSDIKSK